MKKKPMFEKSQDDYLGVFDASIELKAILDDPYKIDIEEDIKVKLMHLNVPRQTLYAQKEAVKAELDSLVAKGIPRKMANTNTSE